MNNILSDLLPATEQLVAWQAEGLSEKEFMIRFAAECEKKRNELGITPEEYEWLQHAAYIQDLDALEEA